MATKVYIRKKHTGEELNENPLEVEANKDTNELKIEDVKIRLESTALIMNFSGEFWGDEEKSSPSLRIRYQQDKWDDMKSDVIKIESIQKFYTETRLDKAKNVIPFLYLFFPEKTRIHYSNPQQLSAPPRHAM